MKKIALILIILTLVFPGLAKSDQTFEFAVVGNGPTGDQIGMPMGVCTHDDGSVSVYDASTSTFVRYDQTGKVMRRLRVNAMFMASSSSLDSFLFNSFFNPVSFAVDSNDKYYFINTRGLYSIDDNGVARQAIDFSANDPKIDTPVMLRIHKGEFYVLDQKTGVVQFGSDFMYKRTVGTVGTGSGKFANPVNFWVGFDGSIVVLDSSSPSMEETSNELLVMVYNADGKLLREFGSTIADPAADEYALFMPFIGALTRTDLFLVDLTVDAGFSVSWKIKQFKLNGDPEKTWPIVHEDKMATDNILKDLITFMDTTNDGKIYFVMPFSGKIYRDPTAFELVGSTTGSDCLKFPTTSMTTPSGMTYVLDLYPPILRAYNKDGTLAKRVEIKDNFMDMPGFDFALGVDMAYMKGEILVATGFRVLKLDEKTLEKTDSYDLSSSPFDTNMFISITAKDKNMVGLDGSGNITVFSSGVPFTFDARKDLDAKRLTDCAIDKDNNILVLDQASRKIGVFTISGSFLKKIDLNSDMALPVSISTLPTGEIIVLDADRGGLVLLATNGSTITTVGSEGMLTKIDTAEDYKAMPGSFHLPGHVTCLGENLFTVTDTGNCRVQIVKSVAPLEPEKKPAKLSVAQEKLSFGNVYFERDGVSKIIEIENLGEVGLTGSVKTNSANLKVAPKVITADTKSIQITLVPGKQFVWKEFKDSVTIETNGGNITVPVTANVVGKTIKMVIGDTNFEVTTDIAETVVSPRAPQIISGRTYVPLRATGDVFKAEVLWDAAEKKVTYKMGDTTIDLWIGKNTANVNGKSVALQNPPIIVSSSTYVPLRFVSEQLGSKVEWDQNSKTVTITYPTP